MIENIRAAIQAVLYFIRHELRIRIGRFIERARQTFWDNPHASFSARQQVRVAERWLADHQLALEERLHKRMMDAFEGTPAQKKEIVYDELQLLDDESLNVLMMRAHIVSSVMERAREAVVALEVRFEAMKLDGFSVDSRAFTPGAIADGFVETLRDLSVPTEVQILLMEAYSEHGVEMLTEFYRDLNELLSKNGVMPGFKYAIRKSESKSRYVPPSPGGIQGGGSIPSDGAGGGGSGMPGEIPAWPTVAAGAALPAQFAQLLDAKLNAMQEALAHLTGETWKEGTLRKTFRLPPPISLSPEQEESIDHIEAVFLDLIRDTRISARIRAELNRLILPLMSLRLSDAETFKDPDNPVRRFIRQLALLGFRDQETPILEFEHIGLIVGRIVSERAQEVTSFSSGADALYTIARNEVRRQLESRYRPSERAAPTPPSQPDTGQIAGDVLEFVKVRLKGLSSGLHLPSIVQHFVLRLLGPWLISSYQQYGPESTQVKSALEDAGLFFRLLESASDENEHAEKVQLRQRTLEQMAFRAVRARMKESEMRILLEGMAGYFDTLNADRSAGLVRNMAADAQSFVSYLDDLSLTRME